MDAGHVLRVGDPRDQRLAEQPRLLLETHVARRSAELTDRRGTCETQLESATPDAIRLSHLIALWEWTNEAKSDIDAMQLELDQIHGLEQKGRELKSEYGRLASSAAHWLAMVSAAKKAIGWLQRMKGLQDTIHSTQSDLQRKQSVVGSHVSRLSEAERVLEETRGVNWMVRAWKGTPHT